MLSAALAALVLALPTAQPRVVLSPCSPQGVSAQCGTVKVPENRARPGGRTIGLDVVVIPARMTPASKDAFTYLSGGPGGAAATEMPSSAVSIWSSVHASRDIVLVDQRGTGASRPLECPVPKSSLETAAERKAYIGKCLDALPGDPAQYGTRTAADDLEAVRVALGYRSFDVYGTSYGATAAQMYLKLHPSSVRTLVLDGATFLDVPFYSRYAANGQRALDQIVRGCSAQAACARAFPSWHADLLKLITAWNAKPAKLPNGTNITGDGLAGVVQGMTTSSAGAAQVPLVVARAAGGDLVPLSRYVGSAPMSRSMMYWSIMCNEPWVGLNARGPWSGYLAGLTTYTLSLYRMVCAYIPKHAEPASAWTRPHSKVPTLVIAGGADPQDPIGNLPGLAKALPNSKVVVAPGQGHAVGQYGCLGGLVGRFVARGTLAGLDTSCAAALKPPVFATH